MKSFDREDIIKNLTEQWIKNAESEEIIFYHLKDQINYFNALSDKELKDKTI